MNDKRADLAQSVAGYLLEHGLAEAGIRALAKSAGTSDRMLIYYFGSKETLIREAMALIVQSLSDQLDSLLGDARRARGRLLAELTAACTEPAFLPMIRLWFEVVGLAARDIAPFREISHELAEVFIDWAQRHLTSRQRADAVDLFAHLEGRMLLHVVGYPAAW